MIINYNLYNKGSRFFLEPLLFIKIYLQSFLSSVVFFLFGYHKSKGKEGGNGR